MIKNLEGIGISGVWIIKTLVFGLLRANKEIKLERESDIYVIKATWSDFCEVYIPLTIEVSLGYC